MSLYTALGKEVLRCGEHFADACDPGAATLIADTLNMRGDTATGEPMTYEAWSVTAYALNPPQPCRAYQVNDQMICPCGLQWDVNDSEIPQCKGA